MQPDRPGVKEERDYIVNEYWNGVSGCISAKDYWALKNGRATDFVKGRLSFLEKGSRILDIGTGSGVLSVALSMNGYDVVGVDRAYAMIDMAELTAKEFGAHPELRIGDAESLDCEDSSFDAVILRDILWTSFDPDKVISEAVRVLRKGGCLIIIDGNIMRDLRSLDEKERIGKLPEYKRRNLGLGCFDVVDAYYSELPLNDAERPDWDVRALESRAMEVKSVEEIDDPLLYEELRPIANSRFLIVSEKK
jgi:SAM-dependent methyltransferase